MAVCIILCLEMRKQIQENKMTHATSSKLIARLDIETWCFQCPMCYVLRLLSQQSRSLLSVLD